MFSLAAHLTTLVYTSCRPAPTMKTILITGSNSGIGLVATKKLCAAGHQVVMACRSKEKADAATQEVKKENPNAEVTFMELNLASMSSIHQFVEEFHKKQLPLHGLINNAGVFFQMGDKERKVTDDGFEMTIGTNNLGHFLLTHLLLEDLKTTAAADGEARIVNVASSLHDPKYGKKKNGQPIGQPIDFDDFMLEKEGAYSGYQAYKNSKAGNVLFTKYLSRHLEGTGVIVNAICPGFIPGTGLTRHSSVMTRLFLNYWLDGLMKLYKTITRSTDEGGASIVFQATGDELKGKTGGYYSYDKLTESSEETQDEEVQKKMWETCMKLVKLEDPRPSS